jgi:phage major head subunit gpT-like protein
MAITPANFGAFVTNVNTMLGHFYDQDDVSSCWKMFSSEVACTSTQLTIGWTGLLRKMRLWDGPRQPQQANRQTYTIIPQPWENTLSVDRFVIDDDFAGVFYRQLPDLMRQAKRHPDYQIRDLLEASGVQSMTAIQKGPDGVAFWSTSHPVDVYNSAAGTYINDFTSGGQVVSSVTVGGQLSPTAFTSLYEYMMTIKGEDGERLGIRPNMLMHPPTLKAEVELILKSTFFAPPAWGAFASIGSQVGAADNPLRRFGVEPLQNDFLASNTKWYLFDTNHAVKPVQWVVRDPIVTVPQVNEGDYPVFNTHTFQWGQWARNAPGWGFSFLAARSGP